MLVSNFSYGLDFSSVLDAGKGVLDASGDFVKRKVGLEEEEEVENRLRELLKPGVELQISELTGLQPTNIKIDSVPMTDIKGLTTHGIQMGTKGMDITPDSKSSSTRKAEVDFEIDLKLDCLFVFTLKEKTANRMQIKDCKMVFEPDWSDVPKVDKNAIEELMKPGVELQISQFTGLQPTGIEITDVPVTDLQGLTSLGIQKAVEWADTADDSDDTSTKRANVDFETGLKLSCLFKFVLYDQTSNQIKIKSCQIAFEPSWFDVPEVDEVSGGHNPHQ